MTLASYLLLLGLGLVVLCALVYAGIAALGRALFDHVDRPSGDETAPPKDAP